MTMRMPRRALLTGCVALLAGCAAPGRGHISPAGGKADGRILFAVNGATDGKKYDGIYVLTNGGNLKRIVAKDTAYALSYPRWLRAPTTPGQTEDRIAFARTSDRGIYSDLYTARPDGTDQRQLTNFRSKIQYGNDVEAEGNYTVQSSIIAGISWSSGGNFLSFTTDSSALDKEGRPGTKRAGDPMRPWVVEDVTVKPGDVRIHPLAATANIGLPVDSTALSPDGNYMAFTAQWQAANDQNKLSQVYLFNFGTKQWKPLTDAALSFGAYDPAFSPDGQYIAFAGRPDFRVNDLYIVSREVKAPPQKITDTGVARAPVFSPDGKKLAFLANGDGGQFAIYTMDIAPPGGNGAFTAGKPEKVTDGIDWIDARSGLSWIA